MLSNPQVVNGGITVHRKDRTLCVGVLLWRIRYMILHSYSKPQWMILNGQTVRGLTVYCVDAITTWYHIAHWHSFINHSQPQWLILNGQTVGVWKIIKLFLIIKNYIIYNFSLLNSCLHRDTTYILMSLFTTVSLLCQT